MNVGGLVFLAVAAPLVLVLPRRLAMLPLLMTVLYTTREPVVALGPANLTVLRAVVIAGLARALVRGERIQNGVNTVDRLVLAWAACLIGMSTFHASDSWVFRIGLVLSEVGAYMLFRIFIEDLAGIPRVFKMLCLGLAPLALLLLLEKATATNLFGIMGGPGEINIRDGHVRAYGPFAHPILAGTVGATCLPMALYLWRSHAVVASIGVFATLSIVYACTSSGPLVMVVCMCLALALWYTRRHLPLLRWASVVALVALQVVMNDPVYFLMARIDLTGASTGYHRAQLIRSSMEHFSEWWAFGTDYTRHWMATGIHANAIHTDITNHFLQIGVWGGLPLLILFVLLLRAAFLRLGAALRAADGSSPEDTYVVWTLGAMLFGQVVNLWSISLFDQSVTLLYLILAGVGTLPVQVLKGAALDSRTRASAMAFRRHTRSASKAVDLGQTNDSAVGAVHASQLSRDITES